jgi:uncharacterized protein (DUF3820 family)
MDIAIDSSCNNDATDLTHSSDSIILNFGKYRNMTLDYVFNLDKPYTQWLYHQPIAKKYDGLYEELDKIFKSDDNYCMPWGKYKNKPLKWVIVNDQKYIEWLHANDFVIKKCPEIIKYIKAFKDAFVL